MLEGLYSMALGLFYRWQEGMHEYEELVAWRMICWISSKLDISFGRLRRWVEEHAMPCGLGGYGS